MATRRLRSDALRLEVLNQRILIECPVHTLQGMLLANFGSMKVRDDPSSADLRYRIERVGTRPAYSVIPENGRVLRATTPGEVLFLLEKDISVELQKRRPELFFLHAAAIEWKGKTLLIAAESGGGKSTTAWALLHHGFGYLSDELSPVDLDSLFVHPYPHALALKQAPPPPYALPDETMRLGHSVHPSLRSLSCPISRQARPIGGVLLLEPRARTGPPCLRALGPAEAGARLYPNALNALAHPGYGLDAAVRIAASVPCHALAASRLPETCELISSVLW